MLNFAVRSISFGNKTGSVTWKLLNYGVLATFRYLLFEKFHLSLKAKKVQQKIISEIDLINFFEVDYEFLRFLSIFYDEFIISCQESFLGSKIKTGAISQIESKNRLYLIGIVLYKFRPNLYVETGTQHGISAEFALQFSKAFNLDLTVVSFDVNSASLIIPNYSFKQILLKKPVRKNFVKYLNKFRNRYNRIVFFHDSDHSYENMYSEFTAAWKILNPVAILTDDANLNKSFSDFCCSKELDFIEFSLGHGNSVGFSKI
jgi:hypothetical protein